MHKFCHFLLKMDLVGLAPKDRYVASFRKKQGKQNEMDYL